MATPWTSSQLAGKSILIFGVANRKSVAWHIGRVLTEAGARCVYVVQNEEVRAGRGEAAGRRPRSSSATSSTKSRSPGSATSWPRRSEKFHGLVHSIAFADYSDGPEALPRNAEAGLPAGGRHLLLLARWPCADALKDLLDPDASVVTISISTTHMASENYGYMAPIKAALDSLAWPSWPSRSAGSPGCGSTPSPRGC